MHDCTALSFPEAQRLVEDHRQHRRKGQGGFEERPDVVGYSHIQAGQEIAAQPEDDSNPDHKSPAVVHACARNNLDSRRNHEAGHEDKDRPHHRHRHDGQKTGYPGEEAEYDEQTAGHVADNPARGTRGAAEGHIARRGVRCHPPEQSGRHDAECIRHKSVANPSGARGGPFIIIHLFAHDQIAERFERPGDRDNGERRDK